MKHMTNAMLLLFLSALLVTGTAFALGAKGDGMDGKGKGLATDQPSMEKQEGKMMQEGTTMKDGGINKTPLMQDDMKHDSGSMMKDEGMRKDSGMMNGKDAMK